MEKKDNGDGVIDKTTIDIAKEILVTVGLVFVLTRVVHCLLLPGCYKSHE